MHNFEVNESGFIRGWVSGKSNGAPSHLTIMTNNSGCMIIAATERPDVLAAGYTLFSGFRLIVSAPPGLGMVRAFIESDSYDVPVEPREDGDFLRIDEASDDALEGWIDSDVPLQSLYFSDGNSFVFPNVIERPDIVTLKRAENGDKFGFRIDGKCIAAPKFCVVNNSHIHVFASAFNTEEEAA